MEQIRVIKELRDESRKKLGTDDHRRIVPRFMVWENVPGAFSSNNGEDFRAVLEETARIADKAATIPRPAEKKGKLQWSTSGCIMGDGWSIAWRVHDAQFWGVPQRRKRIALVADFAGGGAPEILFERESLPRDSEQSEEKREEVTGSIGTGIDKAITFQERGGRPGGGKGILIQNDRTGALSTVNNQMVFDASRRHDYQPFEDVRVEDGKKRTVYDWHRQDTRMTELKDVCVTAAAGWGAGGNNMPYVLEELEKPQTYQKTTGASREGQGWEQTDVTCLNDQGGSVMSVSENVVGALRAQEHGHQPIVFEPGAASRVGGHVYEDKAGTVRANAGDNQQAVVYGISSYNSNAMKSDNPNSGIYEAETARTLDLNGGSPACNQGGMAVVQAAGVDTYNQTMDYEVAQPLRAADGGDSTPKVVCIEGNGQLAQAKLSENNTIYSIGHDIRSAKLTDDEITDPLTATDYKDPIKILDNKKTYQDVTGTLDCGIAKGTSNQLANSNMFVANTSVVRRLTPTECERLQGYPDGWTDIGEWVDTKGKKHKAADSPRYKALGNSIALPFWQWMAERMVRLIKNDEPEKEPTMASLFDGIGGFPLVYSRCGCKPVWCSEIEEFPIAVTKVRFPENATPQK